ncbi:Fe-S cluster assembly protein SufB [Haloplasma contractile]|uniref:FeS assembly protein SufB n=1 Tax=Haloplasma contractile SSD-17B TaxID=1033810 RepID=U2EEF0_9MOLU|nr:Fe-S cluster assembly protein SufB [Haloplasma contractile]ERJ13358.1 FeS assembly protein SufB [Haloplasma contractile SSD-17B]
MAEQENVNNEFNDTKNEINEIVGSDYKYGFKTNAKRVFDTGKGLNEAVVRKISEMKGEPEWMLKIRLKAYDYFLKAGIPSWPGAPIEEISQINYDDYTYFIKSTDKTEKSWDDVPEDIKDTFAKLGIPEAEQKFLAGVSTQFESEVVYHKNLKELEDQGVIFMDTDSALREYPELFKEYFAKSVPYTDNKFAALNTAVWSGGSFIYVPKGVKVEKPLQSYFRINSEQMGQFERTLIIVDEGASVHYVEGCTAPIYSQDSLHAAVVEIFVRDEGYCRYSTVQNWANNIINLVTKRAMVDRSAHMEWIDGNIGSGVNMKYPACVLRGEGAKGTTVSIAFASEGMNQDTGAKMIHLAPNTTSNIISKSIARGGGRVNYRGLVEHGKKAIGAKSNVECDTIILDGKSTSDTIPFNIVKNNRGTIQHEATVSKVSEEQLFYLMSRGLSEEQAMEMIIMGFIEPFARELPMEYAVELNQLLKLEMEGAIG